MRKEAKCCRWSISDVGVVTLDRPDGLNALNFELISSLSELIRSESAKPNTRALVITGVGSSFSSGGDLLDLNDCGNGLQSYVGKTMPEVTLLCETILSSPVPVVAAVNGACIGGGFGLAMMADIVVAARSAYFVIPQVPKIGAVPDAGATWVLSKLVGRARALGMALLGEHISAERAVDWGLIWQCVDDLALPDTAHHLALQLSVNADAAISTRSLIDQSYRMIAREQLDQEAEKQENMFRNPAVKSVLERFSER